MLFRKKPVRTAPGAGKVEVPQAPAVDQATMDSRYGETPLPEEGSREEANRQLQEYTPVIPDPRQQVMDRPMAPPPAVNPAVINESMVQSAVNLDPSPLAARQRTMPDPANLDSDYLTPEQMAYPNVPIIEGDYAQQYEQEQRRNRDMTSGFEAMQDVVDPITGERMLGDFNKAASNILGEANTISDLLTPNERPRYSNTETEIENAADRAAPVLQYISSQARRNLLSTDSNVFEPGKNGERRAKGFAIMADSGFNDSEMQSIADIVGIASNAALSQTPTAKKELEEDLVVDPATGAVDYDNLVQSITHFSKNIAKTLGLETPNPSFFEELAATFVEAEIQQGSFLLNRDSKGNLQYLPTDYSKQMAKRVGDVARVTANALGRRSSGTTPAISGSAINSPQTTTKKSLTSKSLVGQDLDMSKAEAAKDIQGSVPYVYLPSHVAILDRFISAVLSPEYMVDSLKDGVYSTHFMAAHYGLSKKDYNKIKNNQQPPKDETKRINWSPIDSANQIMRNIIKQKAMVLEAIQGAKGVRFAEFMHSIVNHRYFPNSFDLDFMGSKDMIRDILNFAERYSVR
jgi:hypothetical protein